MTTTDELVSTARSVLRRATYINGIENPTWKQWYNSRRGDCSDFTHALYNAYGISISGMSYEQAKDGVEIASWRGKASDSVAAFNKIKHLVIPGDLVCMSLRGVINAGVKPNHVEMMSTLAGDSIGHGYGIGPTEHKVTANDLLGNAVMWTVRRIIIDDGDNELNQDQANKLDAIYAMLHVPGTGYGYPQANNNAINALPDAIFYRNFPRGGNASGTTNLAGMVSWNDSHINDIQKAIAKVVEKTIDNPEIVAELMKNIGVEIGKLSFSLVEEGK